MSGGAELEGRTYVNGNFDVQKSSGAFNVGYVGAGSYVIPDNGADALIVGGNILTAGAKVYFGGYLGAVDLPMNLKYKGSSSVTPPGFFQAGDIPGGTEGQLINEPSLDLSSYQNLLTTWGNTSTTYGACQHQPMVPLQIILVPILLQVPMEHMVFMYLILIPTLIRAIQLQ